MPSRLCERCSLMAQLDANINGAEMKHHSSYQKMVGFAKVGCEICSAVVLGIGERSLVEIVKQKQSSLHDHETDDMQIFCRAVQRGHGQDSYLHIVFEGKQLGTVRQFLSRRSAIDEDVEERFNPKVGLSIPRSCRSPACFEMVQQWTTRCRENHERCNRDPASPSTMPTRVLDIGDLATPPRILVTHGKNEEYATLSYCWGKGYQQPITTTYNLEQRRTALYLTTLRPVFQDAITITRKLGYRYLWIDSLCILQDSVDDWNAELVKMNQYYTCSSLNIIAAAAEDPTCGIFDSADLSRYTISYEKRSVYHIPGQNFVQKRAWTLQEEILPSRSILYASNSIYWLCNHEAYRETRPAQPQTGGFSLHSMSRTKLLFNLPVRWDKRYQHVLPQEGDEENENFFYCWYEILNDYSRRKLSFDQDRLPGIAGLAKEIARRTNAEYLCGLWREHFITGLCWNGNRARIKSSEYIGPTWLWATLDALDRRDLLYDRYLSGVLLVDDENTAEFVDVHIVNEAQDPYGKVKEAVVVLEGPSRKRNTLSDPSDIVCSQGDWGYPDKLRCILDEVDDQSGYSSGSPIFAHPETIYLQLGKWAYGTKKHTIFALVLEPTGRKNVHFSEYIEYRRVGIAEYPPNDEFTKGWIKQKVAII